MNCAICGKLMPEKETEPTPHDVCVKCFWEEEKKQRNKRYVPRFNLLARTVSQKKSAEET